ncbi:alkaline phosphatase family protein [Amnibacterium sp. CER49]|uniref:phospholipase C n=1 Tax=Amnibacterium sp. CER49 TaxID=3039161 RepID=UPI00244958EB|nr:alkaline phosphatase family protein [Amnibacterium sp. CER49]MDH2443347.1 alkaline phosphatase family protein [Amnibacterium sp. CER49]
MPRSPRTRRTLAGAAAAAGVAALVVCGASPSNAAPPTNGAATPIQHLVVIYQENVSFDHYFGTYPKAANTDGQPFSAASGTPASNNFLQQPGLLTDNPNRRTDDPSAPANPRRYSASTVNDLLTCDQDHDYTDEQKAFDGGLMDRFPQTVGAAPGKKSPEGSSCNPNDVMNYYDGNTVTGLWNYAQRYAMSDNSYGTTFGPSSPGAINLVSGDTGDVDMSHTAGTVSTGVHGDVVPNGKGGYSLISDAQPYWDDCSTRDAVAMQGQNIGDLLNAKGLSWGWFQGGFRPSTSYATAAPGQPTSTFTPDQFKGRFSSTAAHQSDQGICNTSHPVGSALPGAMQGTGQYGYKDDYIPHHEPFQYYASTANPHHLTPATDASGHDTLAALRTIGTDTQSYVGGKPQFDTPNHNYDTSDFADLVGAITRGDLPPTALPAVSFLKAPGYQDGHAAYSDPIDEQRFVVNEINALQKSPDWKSTAVVIAYDDSDGWYDHAYSGVTNPSNTVADALTGPNACGDSTSRTPLGGEQGRCGYGPRQPLLVVSPYSRTNAIDHTLTDQSSILRFAEDNWGLGRIDDGFDATANSLTGLFAFPTAKATGDQYPYGDAPNKGQYLLDPQTGRPVSVG